MMNFLSIHTNVNRSMLYNSQIYQQLFLKHLPTKVIANVLGNNVILKKCYLRKKRLVIISVYSLIES